MSLGRRAEYDHNMNNHVLSCHIKIENMCTIECRLMSQPQFSPAQSDISSFGLMLLGLSSV